MGKKKASVRNREKRGVGSTADGGGASGKSQSGGGASRTSRGGRANAPSRSTKLSSQRRISQAVSLATPHIERRHINDERGYGLVAKRRISPYSILIIDQMINISTIRFPFYTIRKNFQCPMNPIVFSEPTSPEYEPIELTQDIAKYYEFSSSTGVTVIYPFIQYINHDESPDGMNGKFFVSGGLVYFISIRAIEEGEEICYSYYTPGYRNASGLRTHGIPPPLYRDSYQHNHQSQTLYTQMLRLIIDPTIPEIQKSDIFRMIFQKIMTYLSQKKIYGIGNDEYGYYTLYGFTPYLIKKFFDMFQLSTQQETKFIDRLFDEMGSCTDLVKLFGWSDFILYLCQLHSTPGAPYEYASAKFLETYPQLRSLGITLPNCVSEFPYTTFTRIQRQRLQSTGSGQAQRQPSTGGRQAQRLQSTGSGQAQRQPSTGGRQAQRQIVAQRSHPNQRFCIVM